MDIYFSFTSNFSDEKNFLQRNLERNAYTNVYPWIKATSQGAKNIYKDVYLITDIAGADFLKDIQFKDVFIVLDGINQKYKNQVSSLSKLYAIKYIAEKGKPFVHIDNDFLITKPFPINLKESKILVQSIEFEPNKLGYNIEKYNKFCKNKHSISNVDSDISYNCGIIGGTDCDLLYKFANEAIKIVEDPDNKNFWLKKYYGFKPWTKAVLAEQYFLSCFLKKQNIQPNLFFDNSFALNEKSKRYNYNPKENKWFFETGGIHYFGLWKKLETYRFRTGIWPNKFQRILLRYFNV